MKYFFLIILAFFVSCKEQPAAPAAKTDIGDCSDFISFCNTCFNKNTAEKYVSGSTTFVTYDAGSDKFDTLIRSKSDMIPLLKDLLSDTTASKKYSLKKNTGVVDITGDENGMKFRLSFKKDKETWILFLAEDHST